MCITFKMVMNVSYRNEQTFGQALTLMRVQSLCGNGRDDIHGGSGFLVKLCLNVTCDHR